MTISIQSVDIHITELQTRMPFKYGIAEMVEAPHVFVRVQLVVEGQSQFGIGADLLPPKWFTKNPTSPFRQDIGEMLAVIRAAADFGRHTQAANTVFDIWQQIYGQQQAWAATQGYPPLLWGFGISLIERAMIDAYCRASQTPFAQAVQHNTLGVRLDWFHPDLTDSTPADFLPARPPEFLIARHTVGLSDPLTEADIPAAERLDDGLPQSLAACIDTYGLTHFKLKLNGDATQDRDRLQQIAAVIEASGLSDYAFTLDGNEQYKEIAPFADLWRQLSNDPDLASFMDHLLFVEQPLHRDVALSDETRAAMLAWSDRPPIIIDESDGAIDSLPTALDCGYVGTSHKNCKGVFKGIANACLIAQRRRLDPSQPYVISGEDLANVGPVALLQDATVMAVLGVAHVERNGHHYFRGLSMFPQSIQTAVLTYHDDLYARHPDGYPTLKIEAGNIATGSLLAAPFGLAFELDPTGFTPIETWDAAVYD